MKMRVLRTTISLCTAVVILLGVSTMGKRNTNLVAPQCDDDFVWILQ